MPDIFNIVDDIISTDIYIKKGDNFEKSFDFKGIKEASFISSVINYKIPLFLDENNKWALIIYSYQTKILGEGNYRYEIQVRYDNDEIDTLISGVVYVYSSAFPIYKNFPVVTVAFNRNPKETDTQYGVPSLWYNRENQFLWVLDQHTGSKAFWKKISSPNYIYQLEIAEDFKFLGDTTYFSFIQILEDKSLKFINGVYDVDSGLTSYDIPLLDIEETYFYLYRDKNIEYSLKSELYENDLEVHNVICKYHYSKNINKQVDNLKETVKELIPKIENLENRENISISYDESNSLLLINTIK